MSPAQANDLGLRCGSPAVARRRAPRGPTSHLRGSLADLAHGRYATKGPVSLGAITSLNESSLYRSIVTTYPV